MDLRTAYKMVIAHQLELLEESERWVFASGQKEELVETLHDEGNFLDHLEDAVEEHLEAYGENYNLY